MNLTRNKESKVTSHKLKRNSIIYSTTNKVSIDFSRHNYMIAYYSSFMQTKGYLVELKEHFVLLLCQQQMSQKRFSKKNISFTCGLNLMDSSFLQPQKQNSDSTYSKSIADFILFLLTQQIMKFHGSSLFENLQNPYYCMDNHLSSTSLDSISLKK